MNQTGTSRTKRDFLWAVLFLIVFINGFEAGGYQASLWHIGQDYDLSVTSMGLYASMELFATMLAPLLLGRWADRSSKEKSLGILLSLQLAASVVVFLTQSRTFFLAGVFFLGLTTSALQFIAIAALADAYPVSGKRRIGYLTSMYATGAFCSPLVVSFYLKQGLDWRTLFSLLAAGSAIALTGLLRSGCQPRETAPVTRSGSGQGNLLLRGVLLLCVVMCIYVGFENGFTFFVDTLFTDVLKASTGKLALSLFWVVMIPSRVLVGHNARHAERILLFSVIAIPCLTLLLSHCADSRVVLLLCIPLGFACGAIYPSVLTMLLPFAGSHTATATGMITTATGIGGVVFTALTGFVADRWGMSNAMTVLSLCFLLSLLSVVGVRTMNHRQE